MYYSKDIESFGTGLKRIADACDTAGVTYEFKKMKSGFAVCFYRLEAKADKKPIKADRQEIIIKYVLDGAERIFILSNSKLKPALHIYGKYGFREIKLNDYEYVRGDIAFEYRKDVS